MQRLYCIENPNTHLNYLCAMILDRLHGRYIFTSSSQRVTSSSSSPPLEPWYCQACTYLNLSSHQKQKDQLVCTLCNTAQVISIASTEKRKRASRPCSSSATEVIDLLDTDSDSDLKVVEEEVEVEIDCVEPVKLNYHSQLEALASSPYSVPMPSLNFSNQDEVLNILKKCRELSHTFRPLLHGVTSTSTDAVRCFYVQGKRFGDRQRKGKSRFCGMNSELLTVEQLVMEKCFVIDSDSVTDHIGSTNSHQSTDIVNLTNAADRLYSFVTIEYTVAIQGGGWSGWHCEGGLLRTLAGLLMWDVFFSNVCSDGAAVFLTPYQDAPLDFPYASYFLRRYTYYSNSCNA